jgi:hypothetical protein
LRQEVQAWEEARNAAVVKVDWQFTTADARIKLKKPYPTIELQWCPSGTCAKLDPTMPCEEWVRIALGA